MTEGALRALRILHGRLEDVVGGRARLHVVLVLSCVLALDSADLGAVSATARQLQHAFHVGTAQIGLMLTVTQFVGAAFTLPFGILADRARRTRLLLCVIALWAVSMVATSVSTSYLFLILTRVSLGAVSAVAYPVVASLLGDFFPPAERGRIYGFVLSGELIGTGFGIVIAGGAASVFSSWRASFLVLALPALVVMWLLHRLPEPARGGASLLPAGADRIVGDDEVGVQQFAPDAAGMEPAATSDDQQDSTARSVVHDMGIRANDDLVLRRNPSTMSLWSAIRYILRIRTNVVVIVASALGYYFFAGVRGFGVEYAQYHFGLAQAAASALLLVVGLGALGGVLVGGRIADRLLHRGQINSRILVPAAALIIASLLMAPAVYSGALFVAVPILIVANFAQASSNPPLDAARLDVMVPGLWGRAEAVRTVVRSSLQAVAPLVFGAVAQYAFGGRNRGLEFTFLVMLVPLLVSGLVLLLAKRTYGPDVATADASIERLGRTMSSETDNAVVSRLVVGSANTRAGLERGA